MDQEATPVTVGSLLREVADARLAARRDPFANPALRLALRVSRLLDDGEITLDGLGALLAELGRDAFARRAADLARRAGGADLAEAEASLALLAARAARPDPADSPVPFAQFRAAAERPRAAAVFTAHPTFSLPDATGRALAEAASGTPIPDAPLALRPAPVTLEDEFAQATRAIAHGRDALDRLARAFLETARATWPDRWVELVPRPVLLASWVGYDTDGRTDILWHDTLRLRLRMKRLQLERLRDQFAHAPALRARTEEALEAVSAQIAACPPPGAPPSAEATQTFARALVGRREAAMTGPEPLLALFPAALAEAPDDAARLALCVARAGLAAHGLSLAHTHVRLNAAQVHNAARQRFGHLGLDGGPEDPARRRGLFAAANAALEQVRPEPVDLGGVAAEPASAARLMMTVAQMLKHVDGSQPVRFLIAETESGYTLLAALLLARQCGVEDRVEISPLFETAEALERGARILEEALRSPEWRAHLRRAGRVCLQFGYSDSGRYVGQIAATQLIERAKLRIAEALARHGLSDLELVLFDTHGEGLGRGGHPGGVAARLDYLHPAAVRAELARRGTPARTESAFQGGDGYLLFGTPPLAASCVARIAEHAFAASESIAEDPAYAEGGFAGDLFAGARAAMGDLLEQPGYAALLGAFGPALLDKSGSRPAARQSDSADGPVIIRHPRELRAIPNNAVLQQLGFLANLTHGLGAGAAREPEMFAELLRRSPRFANAMAFARAGLALSDAEVLRGYVASLDPGTWVDRAARARAPARSAALARVAAALEELGLADGVRATFRRLQADDLRLRAVWPAEDGAEAAMSDRLFLVHALRLALIHRIWLLAVAVPEFSPRPGLTRDALVRRLLRLDVEWAAAALEEVFPASPPPEAALDFAEPPSPRRSADGYGEVRREITLPLRTLFALAREASAVVTLECGAFG